MCLSNLHPNDGIDEEEHGDEQADVRQSLEGLDEGPQENSDGVTLPQKFDETSCSEELQKAHVERINKLGEGRDTGVYWWCLIQEYSTDVHINTEAVQAYSLSLSTDYWLFLSPAGLPRSLWCCPKQWWSQKCSTCLESSSVENRKDALSNFKKGSTFRLRVALFSHQKAEGQDLEDTLDREENSERRVQVLQYGVVCRRGRVILKKRKTAGFKQQEMCRVSGI